MQLAEQNIKEQVRVIETQQAEKDRLQQDLAQVKSQNSELRRKLLEVQDQKFYKKYERAIDLLGEERNETKLLKN